MSLEYPLNMHTETIVYDGLSYTSFAFKFYNGVTVTIGIEEGDASDIGYLSPIEGCMKCYTFDPDNYTFVSIEKSIPREEICWVCSFCEESFEGYELIYIWLRNIMYPLRVFLRGSPSYSRIILVNDKPLCL